MLVIWLNTFLPKQEYCCAEPTARFTRTKDFGRGQKQADVDIMLLLQIKKKKLDKPCCWHGSTP
jgi:hypothetical protein